MPEIQRVLLTGATGFVGLHAHPVLAQAGFEVVGASRDAKHAQEKQPGSRFVTLDLEDYDSVSRALEGRQAAVYLVHSMGEGKRYERIEQREAEHFVRAAERAGLERIVYLGGIQPSHDVSRHLQSRARVGEILRSGSVSTVELQASMVIGPGSESWRLVRDLAARTPILLLPSWAKSRSQPIYIDDVTAALRLSLTLEQSGSQTYTLPGPDTLTAGEILIRTVELMGLQPRTVNAPFITPQLSSYWIALVTRANPKIARQLVEGLRVDLTAPDLGFWKQFPEHELTSFDEAARRALRAEVDSLSIGSQLAEWLIQSFTPRRSQ